MKVDFATFCHKGDVERLHVIFQLSQQVKSNNYLFYNVFVVYQSCSPQGSHAGLDVKIIIIEDINYELSSFGIDIDKPQYVSSTDKAHAWKNHVVNHIVAIKNTNADYIVFADADCWMVQQPNDDRWNSWIIPAMHILQDDSSIFIVSPNDGEPERKTLRMSQQMFLARVDEFRNADFNQPGYTGNPRDYDTMPEYHAMLEGRMEYHCREAGQWRYVLGPEYRYFHHNVLTEDGHYDTDYKKLGWL